MNSSIKWTEDQIGGVLEMKGEEREVILEDEVAKKTHLKFMNEVEKKK